MKIFISHSSKDKDYGDALVELLRGIDIKHDQITYTSRVPTGIPFGENIFDWLKEKLKEKPHVLFLLSPDYYASIACQNEMGASWVLGSKQTMFFTPELDLDSYDFRNGALNPRDIGINLDDKDRIFEFVEYLETEFQLKKKGSYLNREVDKFLAKVAKIKKDRLEIKKEQKETANSSLPAPATSPKEVLSEELNKINAILKDIQIHRSSLTDQKDFNRYVRLNHFENIDANTEVRWFKQLWDHIFRNEKINARTNIHVLYQLLLFLFNRNPQRCTDLIRADHKFFNIISRPNFTINYLIRFLAYNEDLIQYFENGANILIKSHVNSNLDYRMCAWFLNENYPTHLDRIKLFVKDDDLYDFDPSPLEFIIEIGIEKGFKKEMFDFILWWLNKSFQHANPIEYLDELLMPNFDVFDEEQLHQLCAVYNQYADTYYIEDDEKNSLQDFKGHILSKFPSFNFELYPALLNN